MKYVIAMIHIWKNMVANRPPRALFALSLIGLVALTTSINCYLQHPNKVGIALSAFALIAWLFGFPCAIFLIDVKSKRNSTQHSDHRTHQ